MYIHRLVSPFFCYVCDVTFLVEITVSLSQFWMGKWAFFVAFQSTKKGGLLKRGGEGPGHLFSQITCFLGGAAIPHCVLASEYSGWMVKNGLSGFPMLIGKFRSNLVTEIATKLLNSKLVAGKGKILCMCVRAHTHYIDTHIYS